MAIPKKTFHSPYITHVQATDLSSGSVTVEGDIDLIKVTGTDAAQAAEANRSSATFNVWGSGVSNENVEILAGDVLEGPFTKVECTLIDDGATAGTPQCDVWIYQRSKVITG